MCVFVENSCPGHAVVTNGRESVMFCWLLTETHGHGFLSHFCTASAIGNSAWRSLLLRSTTVPCASLFLLLVAVYVCSFKEDWSHTCGSYRFVEIELSWTIWVVNGLASEGLLLRNRYAEHAVTSVSAPNHQTSWTFVPALLRFFDSRGEGIRAECLHAAVQSAFIQ